MKNICFNVMQLATMVAADDNVIELGLVGGSANSALSGKIASLEAQRSELEDSKLQALSMAYQRIVAESKLAISSIIAKRSFLKMNPVEPSVLVRLDEKPFNTDSAIDAANSIESERADSEQALLDSAVQEISEFQKFIVSTFSQEISRAGSFMRLKDNRSSRVVNIKVLPETQYSTAQSMIGAMENRRGIAEDNVRSIILNLELSVAKDLNSFIEASLNI